MPSPTTYSKGIPLPAHDELMLVKEIKHFYDTGEMMILVVKQDGKRVLIVKGEPDA